MPDHLSSGSPRAPRHRGLSRRALLAGPTAIALGHLAGSGPALARQATPSALDGWVDASAFGLTGDGETDDTPALQAAVDEAAARQVPLVIPPGTYGVARPLELRTGSIVSGYGATLVTWIPDLGDPGEAFPTVRIYDVEHVTVGGLTVEGRKDAFPHTQWKHGFGINNARDIFITHCHANRCKGDGIILSDKNIGDVCVDITVESCSFGENYRMGGTASGALRATFWSCTFWGTLGTLPMCGFDVEPDRADVTCQDVAFYNCAFIDNGDVESGEGYGFNVSYIPDATGPQFGVYLENCTIARNAASGIDFYRVPRGIEMRNCQVTDNAEDGIRIFANATDIAIVGGRVAGNGQHGIHSAVEPEAPCMGIEIDGVQVSDNGWSEGFTGNGIHLDNLVDDIRVTNSSVSGSAGYGLYVAPTVTGLETSGLSFADNALGETFPDTILEDA